MKKNISIFIAVVAALSIHVNSASASLLGMPINLKIAIELRNVDAPAPACQFYTDEFWPVRSAASQGVLIPKPFLNLYDSPN